MGKSLNYRISDSGLDTYCLRLRFDTHILSTIEETPQCYMHYCK